MISLDTSTIDVSEFADDQDDESGGGNERKTKTKKATASDASWDGVFGVVSNQSEAADAVAEVEAEVEGTTTAAADEPIDTDEPPWEPTDPEDVAGVEVSDSAADDADADADADDSADDAQSATTTSTIRSDQSTYIDAIQNAYRRLQQAEAYLDQCKEAAKAAKEEVEGAKEELLEVIAGGIGVKRGSRGGEVEVGVDGVEGVVGAATIRLHDEPTPPTVDFWTATEDDATDDPAIINDDRNVAWRSHPASRLAAFGISKAVYKSLEGRGFATLGKLYDQGRSDSGYCGIERVGKSKAAKIEAAMNAFLASIGYVEVVEEGGGEVVGEVGVVEEDADGDEPEVVGELDMESGVFTAADDIDGEEAEEDRDDAEDADEVDPETIDEEEADDSTETETETETDTETETTDVFDWSKLDDDKTGDDK